MLVTNIFFFSRDVLEKPLFQGREKLGLCGNGLN